MSAGRANYLQDRITVVTGGCGGIGRAICERFAKADALARHPVGRFGRPEDVAKLAVWLASEDSAFASGQYYTLAGGLTAASPLKPGLF